VGQLDSESDREVESPRRLRGTGPCGRGLFAASVISLGVYVAPTGSPQSETVLFHTRERFSRTRSTSLEPRTEAHTRNRVTFASASMREWVGLSKGLDSGMRGLCMDGTSSQWNILLSHHDSGLSMLQFMEPDLDIVLACSMGAAWKLGWVLFLDVYG
jgi:hypothetical protein